MRNCDVWKCSAVIDSSKGSVAWEQLQLAYRTELAEESLLSSLFSRSESSDEEIELEEQEEQIVSEQLPCKIKSIIDITLMET